MLARLKQWRDDRYRLIQLNYDRESANQAFDQDVAERMLNPSSDEYGSRYAELAVQLDVIDWEIDRIETRRAVARAIYWQVPLPPRPFKRSDEDEFWLSSSIDGKHYLTEHGKAHLRREIHREWEMWSKPWLSWGAVAISIVSLAVAALKP